MDGFPEGENKKDESACSEEDEGADLRASFFLSEREDEWK